MRSWAVLLMLAVSSTSSSALAQRLEPELGVMALESEPAFIRVVAQAAAGPEHVLVYTHQTTSTVSTRFAVVAGDGTIVRAPDVLLPLETGSLSCRGADCALISTERTSIVGTTPTVARGVFVVRFRTDGTVVDPVPLTLALVDPLARRSRAWCTRRPRRATW